MKIFGKRPLRAAIYTALVTVALIGTAACSNQRGGGGGGMQEATKVTYQGQRLETAGGPMSARPAMMVAVGRAADGKPVFMQRGGGGGGIGAPLVADQPLYVSVGNGQYQVLVPEPRANHPALRR
jgi:hypothetical protein